jgi:hypothetical protein
VHLLTAAAHLLQSHACLLPASAFERVGAAVASEVPVMHISVHSSGRAVLARANIQTRPCEQTGYSAGSLSSWAQEHSPACRTAKCKRATCMHDATMDRGMLRRVQRSAQQSIHCCISGSPGCASGFECCLQHLITLQPVDSTTASLAGQAEVWQAYMLLCCMHGQPCRTFASSK